VVFNQKGSRYPTFIGECGKLHLIIITSHATSQKHQNAAMHSL